MNAKGRGLGGPTIAPLFPCGKGAGVRGLGVRAGCRNCLHPATAALLLLVAGALPAGEERPSASTVEKLADDVIVVRDDDGNWSDRSAAITHQRGPHYWAKKVLDLSDVSEEAWKAAGAARLSAYFCLRDYSTHDLPQPNGLDDRLEIVVNGQVHALTASAGLPKYLEGKSMRDAMAWFDLPLPKSELKRGPNEIIFRLRPAEGKKPDDYLYLGIDNGVPTRRSWVRMAEKADWRQDALNAADGHGEYMVRLYLLGGPRDLRATWQPVDGPLDDPAKLIEYAGAHGGPRRLEWNPLRLDRTQDLTVTIEADGAGPLQWNWLAADGTPLKTAVKGPGPRLAATLKAPWPVTPAGLEVPAALKLKQISLQATQGYHALPPRLDITPAVARPKAKASQRKPDCRIEADKVTLSNGNLRCQFQRRKGRLCLASLHNEWAGAEMVRDSAASALWLVEIDGQRYAGNADFTCGAFTDDAQQQGFSVCCTSEKAGVEAVLSVWIDSQLHASLEVINRRDKPLEFKLAFPHLAGLAVAPKAEDDYYFYPAGGGIIADTPALIRQGYGDHQALYQVLDVFSPELGAGLALWSSDDDGRYKVLALRKHVAGRTPVDLDKPQTPTSPEFQWTNSLPETTGVGMAIEYLRRTRKPGEGFAAKPVVLWAHAGDWRVPLRHYAEWCHKVWEFRRLPSRLTPVLNMIAVGWGSSPLFRDGRYRTDFVQPRADCLELMSWWEWSELGPWRTPWDQLEKRLGAAAYLRYKPYFVKDPVTGRTMYPLSRGDYDGYNRRWGGLPALRAAIDAYRQSGALVTLYTDPLLADDNTRCGQQWGQRWGIVNPDGKYRTNYESWNMCHDVAEYRHFVAQTMERVMRETGADGIRLDEYGHRGAACFSTQHEHTFAERGCTEWQRAIAETTKMVRRAMDEVRPDSVLTTEHPGYDYLMQYLDGCITYDLTVQASPLRPLECNLQRFLFPECKAYELDHRGADRRFTKRFWNAVGAFGSKYPEPLDAILRENVDVFSSPECEPLIPTLAKYLYANEFRGGDKTFYLLYNAMGHSYAGRALRLAIPEGHHAVELVRPGVPLSVTAASNGKASEIELFVPRDDVAALAVLPALLDLDRDGSKLEVSLANGAPTGKAVLCDADGKLLAEHAIATATPWKCDLAAAGLKAGGVGLVKLLVNGRLLDALPLP